MELSRGDRRLLLGLIGFFGTVMVLGGLFLLVWAGGGGCRVAQGCGGPSPSILVEVVVLGGLMILFVPIGAFVIRVGPPGLGRPS